MDPTTDPHLILARLDAERITSRLHELEGERRGLLALLRAARARDRELRRASGQKEAVAHA
jgi:hypothetical protein